MPMLVRNATTFDSEAMRNVYRSAFDASESDITAELAISLLSESADEEIISLLAQRDDQVLGHVCFSPVHALEHSNWLGYLLAPLAVMATAQHAGIGSQLVRAGLAKLAEREVNMVLVYGDPDYYARFGFTALDAANCLPPYLLQYPMAWQAIVLREHSAHSAGLQIRCVPALMEPELW